MSLELIALTNPLTLRIFFSILKFICVFHEKRDRDRDRQHSLWVLTCLSPSQPWAMAHVCPGSHGDVQTRTQRLPGVGLAQSAPW